MDGTGRQEMCVIGRGVLLVLVMQCWSVGIRPSESVERLA